MWVLPHEALVALLRDCHARWEEYQRCAVIGSHTRPHHDALGLLGPGYSFSCG